MRRVIIVGAGPCGLVALKEMLAGGHDTMLFERSAQLGGVFASAMAYPNLHLTISNWAMAYSDFPDPTRLRYSSAEEYLHYLQSYARHFNLERHISYRSEVLSATLRDDGLWSLQIRQQKESEQTTFHVDAEALIVATGANQVPNALPEGLAGFTGHVIHSSQYDNVFKRHVAEKRLKVLVIGRGESAADISSELGGLSPTNVTVWLRRYPCIAPRYVNRSNEMEQIVANETADFPANGFLEALTTNRMSAGQNVYAYGFFRRIIWHLPVLNSTLSNLTLVATAPAFLQNDQATYATKNQLMCEAIGDRRIELIVSPTMCSIGRECEFYMPDGTVQKREFDAVVYCTGFRTEFQWIKIPPGKGSLSSNSRSWFLHCFPEGLGTCLFFVGYARPHQGGIPVMAEMLSRYISLLLRGERTLPLDYASQARRDEAASREYYFLSPNLNSLVDYSAFLESIARRVGCEPRPPLSCVLLYNFHMLIVLLLVLHGCCPGLVPWSAQFTFLLWAVSIAGFLVHDDGLLFKWWFYPHWAVWYRQRGPHSDPALLDGVLGRVNLWKSTSITTGFVLLVLWSIPVFYVQSLISVFLFPPNALLNALGIRFPSTWGGLLRPKFVVLHSLQWRLSDLFLP